MKVGLVYYSRTGHTKQIIDGIAEELQKENYDIDIIPLELASPWDASADRLPLKALPDVHLFDRLILGTPVHGGRMSAAIRTFLEESEALSDKKVVFLLTHLFWQGWGADQTIQQMRDLSIAKGATVLGSANVRWLGFRRGQRILEAKQQAFDLLIHD